VLLIGVLGGSLFQPSHWDSRFKVGRGLDISSGTTISLQAVTPPGTKPSSAQMASDLSLAQSIMNSRINGAGFNGASVTTEGTNLINVSVPGKTVNQVETLVGTTAQLRFRQVLLVAPNTASATPTPTPTPSATPTPTPSSSPTPKASTSPSPKPSTSSSASGLGSASSNSAGSPSRSSREGG